MPVSRADLLIECIPQGGLSVEVGVLHGAFAEYILRIQRPDKLILIDTWQDYQQWRGDDTFAAVQDRFAWCIRSGLVELWRGRSVEQIQSLPDRGVGFAYVDADHDYDAVLADLEALLPKIQPGGWLCGHDYCMCNEFGVVRAMAVFCDRHSLCLDVLTNEFPGPWLNHAWNEPSVIAYNSFGVCVP